MSKIPQMFDLTGRTAIITGGAGLLGRQFSRTLAEAGATVVIVEMNDVVAQEVAEEINAEGWRAIAVNTNIADKSSVAEMLETVLDSTGRVDIVVNSAALDPKFDPDNISEQGANAFENFSLEEWQASLNVNLTGMFLVTQAAVAPMLKQGKGSIINLCSTYGLNGPDQRLYMREGQPPQYKPVTYTTTKAGVIGFTKYLAAYYAGKNIRVNALTPGGVFNNHDDEFSTRYAQKTIMGRMADKTEMNGAVLYLASDASSYMTGSNLIVDGGWTAW